MLKIETGSLAGTEVRVALGASTHTELSAQPATIGDLPVNAVAVGPAVSLEPALTRFPTAVEVVLPYRPDIVPQGHGLRVLMLDETPGEPVEMEVCCVDPDMGRIHVFTDRLGVLAAVAVPLPWWDQWPRFSNNNTVEGLQSAGASVSTVGQHLHDEGIGPYARADTWEQGRANQQATQAAGLRSLAWIEGQGLARHYIIAVRPLSAGGYQINPGTGNARIFYNNWNWDQRDASLGTEVRWTGLPSFVNQESFVNPLTLTHPVYGMPVPTYPDGTPATGYLGESDDPSNARFYDAMANKDIHRNLQQRPRPIGTSLNGKIPLPPDGAPCGDFQLGSDHANPWWLEYNGKAVLFFLEQGVDGFWVDNSSGWDFLGLRPNSRAFGEWSVARFREFLDQHPEVSGGLSATFDVRDHLLQQFRSWFPECDERDLRHACWSDPRWLDDPIWRAYLVHKSRLIGERARGLYQTVKEVAAAAENSSTAQDIYVGGNDVPGLTNAAFRGQEIDMVNAEIRASASIPTGPLGFGIPPHGSPGAYYSVATRYGSSRHAVFWYYLDKEYAHLASNKPLAEMLGFEALAHNVLLNSGGQNPRIAGSDASALRVNQVIERVAPVLGQRCQRGRVGLLYSTETQLSQTAPGGPVDYSSPQHNLGFFGWGSAMEWLHVPYRGIPDFRLSAVQLEGLAVLVVPHVLSITEEAVENILVPFVQAGHALIVTGEQSGSIHSQEGLYAPRSSALLYDLVSRPLEPGEVLFIEGNPGLDFYMDRTRVEAGEINPAQRRGLAQIREALESLHQSGYLPMELEFQGSAHVLTVKHEDPQLRRGFVDLVNRDLDLEREAPQPAAASRLIVEVPTSLRARALGVSFYDADKPGPTQPPARFVDPVRLEIDLPAFSAYACLVLDDDPEGIVPPQRVSFSVPFDRSLNSTQGHIPLEASGVRRILDGRVRGALEAALETRLSYDSAEVFDPREGTLALWVRPHWDGDTDAPLFHGLFGFQPTAWNNMLRLDIWRRHILALRSSRNEGDQRLSYRAQTDVGSWKSGEWHHLAASWSAAQEKLVLYVDGTMAATKTSWQPPLAQGNEAPFSLGHLTTANQGLEGDLDEFQLFSQALPSEEVRSLYLGTPPPGPALPPPLLEVLFDNDLRATDGREPTSQVGVGPAQGGAVTLPQASLLDYDSAGFNRSQGTFTAWVRTNWDGEADGDHPSHGIFAFQPAPGKNEIRVYAWKRRVLGIRTYRTETQTTTWKANSSMTDWQGGEWRHVAATWSESRREIVLYVDGQARASATDWYPPALQSGDAPLSSGHLAPANQGLDGQLGQFLVFDECLAPEQVLAIYRIEQR